MVQRDVRLHVPAAFNTGTYFFCISEQKKKEVRFAFITPVRCVFLLLTFNELSAENLILFDKTMLLCPQSPSSKL